MPGRNAVTGLLEKGLVVVKPDAFHPIKSAAILLNLFARANFSISLSLNQVFMSRM